MPRKMKGRGKFKEFLGKANNFLKKSQILSKLGNAYSKYGGMAGLPYTGLVGTASGMAEQAGYGRRRKRRVGKGLRVAGGSVRRGFGLRMAGGARHMIPSRRPMTW
jgi:hypothetical protein